MDPHSEKYYSWSPYTYVANNSLRLIDPTGMDWIENKKTGDVEWRKDITKQENAPKGYSYIGSQYMGVSIIDYKTKSYKTSKSNGGQYSSLEIKIGYKNKDKKNENGYNWVQTVERDDKSKFIDPIEDNGNRPFYQDKETNKKSQNVNDFNIVFYDKPDERSPNGYFKAELSLISNKPTAVINKGSAYEPSLQTSGRSIYNPIITLNYGFSVNNGIMSILPIKVAQPSNFQNNTIENIP